MSAPLKPYRVEYMLEGVDHIPVTMEYEFQKQAQDEVTRIITYPDLVMLKFTKLDASPVLKDGSVRDAYRRGSYDG